MQDVCPPGQWFNETITPTAQCIYCADGKFKPNTGSSAADCFDCPQLTSSGSTENRTRCECNAGYVFDMASKDCVADTYAMVVPTPAPFFASDVTKGEASDVTKGAVVAGIAFTVLAYVAMKLRNKAERDEMRRKRANAARHAVVVNCRRFFCCCCNWWRRKIPRKYNIVVIAFLAVLIDLPLLRFRFAVPLHGQQVLACLHQLILEWTLPWVLLAPWRHAFPDHQTEKDHITSGLVAMFLCGSCGFLREYLVNGSFPFVQQFNSLTELDYEMATILYVTFYHGVYFVWVPYLHNTVPRESHCMHICTVPTVSFLYIAQMLEGLVGLSVLPILVFVFLPWVLMLCVDRKVGMFFTQVQRDPGYVMLLSYYIVYLPLRIGFTMMQWLTSKVDKSAFGGMNQIAVLAVWWCVMMIAIHALWTRTALKATTPHTYSVFVFPLRFTCDVFRVMALMFIDFGSLAWFAHLLFSFLFLAVWDCGLLEDMWLGTQEYKLNNVERVAFLRKQWHRWDQHTVSEMSATVIFVASAVLDAMLQWLGDVKVHDDTCSHPSGNKHLANLLGPQLSAEEYLTGCVETEADHGTTFTECQPKDFFGAPPCVSYSMDNDAMLGQYTVMFGLGSDGRSELAVTCVCLVACVTLGFAVGKRTVQPKLRELERFAAAAERAGSNGAEIVTYAAVKDTRKVAPAPLPSVQPVDREIQGQVPKTDGGGVPSQSAELATSPPCTEESPTKDGAAVLDDDGQEECTVDELDEMLRLGIITKADYDEFFQLASPQRPRHIAMPKETLGAPHEEKDDHIPPTTGQFAAETAHDAKAPKNSRKRAQLRRNKAAAVRKRRRKKKEEQETEKTGDQTAHHGGLAETKGGDTADVSGTVDAEKKSPLANGTPSVVRGGTARDGPGGGGAAVLSHPSVNWMATAGKKKPPKQQGGGTGGRRRARPGGWSTGQSSDRYWFENAQFFYSLVFYVTIRVLYHTILTRQEGYFLVERCHYTTAERSVILSPLNHDNQNKALAQMTDIVGNTSAEACFAMMDAFCDNVEGGRTINALDGLACDRVKVAQACHDCMDTESLW